MESLIQSDYENMHWILRNIKEYYKGKSLTFNKRTEWKCYSTYVDILCANDRMIDMINGLYWKWIYEDKSNNYRNIQANLLVSILEISYARIMANYYKWVEIGYNPMIIKDIL